MQPASFRAKVTSKLLAFAWAQWAQLGVFAPVERHDRAAADPESLVLFTLEVARDDPRLFDEMLDWLLTNESLISVQRLRNLCADADDRDLVEGALGWVARWQPRARFRPSKTYDASRPERPLFRTAARLVHQPDPAFASVGFLKPDTEPSQKSRAPDPLLPATFAFRMRLLFGVGARAEVIRYLFTTNAPDVPAQTVAAAAGYAKRNINETLSALAASQLVTMFEQRNEYRYYMDRGGWGQLLRLSQETWPTHREWVPLLRALRRLDRWLSDEQLDAATPYMLSSQARDVMTEAATDLNAAGVASSSLGSPGVQYWDAFTETVERAIASLDSPAA